jgi:RHS repeat-associated protein
LSNSAGVLAQTYTYDSFGNETASSGSVTNYFRYTGREFDAETGLEFNRARYYDPSSGRFVSEDPIGFGGGANFYAYVGNNSSNYTDVLGLCKKDDCIKNFLKTGYGPAGNFMANTGVPDFSAISIATNTWGWLKGEGLTLSLKGLIWGGPTLYGKMLTVTGQNMANYPGLAGAGADSVEAGSFWTATGATLGDVMVFVGVEGSVFATTADAYARWVCRNVQ